MFEQQLSQFVEQSKAVIPSDGLEGVMHYWEHGEYEMSFEGLVIELIQAGSYPKDFHFPDWKELALHFHLDTESVFDGDFWNKFVLWGEAYLKA